MCNRNSILAVVIISFCIGCSNTGLNNISGGPIKPLVMEGFTMTETDNGRKKLVLIAKNAEIDKSNKLISANDINLRYYNEKEKVASTLTSDKATLTIGTNDMCAEGNVILITEIGAKLETQKLTWIAATDKVITDEPVRFTKGGNVLTGKGFESDSSLENTVIKSASTEITNLKELDVNKKPKVSQRKKIEGRDK